MLTPREMFSLVISRINDDQADRLDSQMRKAMSQRFSWSAPVVQTSRCFSRKGFKRNKRKAMKKHKQ